MNESDKQHIIALWESRVPLEQIYQMLPYTRYEAIKMVKELRDDGTLQPRKKTDEAIKALANAWESESKSPYELAEMFGYSPDTVKRYLSISGVRRGKRPTRNFKHCDKTNEIAKDLKDGKPMIYIAKKFGVSRQYVYQLKQKLEKQNDG